MGRYSKPCHSYLAVRPDIDEKLMEWQDCFTSGPISKDSEDDSSKMDSSKMDISTMGSKTSSTSNSNKSPENGILITTKDEDDIQNTNLENLNNSKNSDSSTNLLNSDTAHSTNNPEIPANSNS